MTKRTDKYMKHIDFIILDMLAMIIAFVLAYIFKFRDWGFITTEHWRSVIVVSCLLNLVIIALTNPYSGIIRRYGSEEFLNTALQSFYNFLFCCLILYVVKIGPNYTRTVIILMYVFYFILATAFRTAWKELLRNGKISTNINANKSIFIVGNRSNIITLLSNINSNFLNEYIVNGVCIIDGEVGETISSEVEYEYSRGKKEKKTISCTNSCKLSDIAEYVLNKHIDEVFVGVKASLISTDIYKKLIDNGKGINLNIKPMVGFSTENQFISSVGTYKTLSLGFYSFTGNQMVYLIVKRIIDVIVGTLGLLALVPLIILVKLSFLISGDNKSIFYTQKRVGLDGKVFNLLKFRSMVYNADEVLEELLKDSKYRKEWEENQKFENDPRITKMGAFLRKTSLDEVPQFINVLRGDMSLIGPRPLVIGELESHNGLQLYNQVKPGITGWWACNGRSNTTYDERLSLEYYYVKNCSLYLDALCVIKTVVAVIKRDGAK